MCRRPQSQQMDITLHGEGQVQVNEDPTPQTSRPNPFQPFVLRFILMVCTHKATVFPALLKVSQ